MGESDIFGVVAIDVQELAEKSWRFPGPGECVWNLFWICAEHMRKRHHLADFARFIQPGWNAKLGSEE